MITGNNPTINTVTNGPFNHNHNLGPVITTPTTVNQFFVQLGGPISNSGESPQG